MDVLGRFLNTEISNQDLYSSIMDFITSFHIRNGEFEGNEYIIRKMDQINFIIFLEYEFRDGHREIHAAEAVYRDNLIKMINEYAVTKEIKVRT